MRWHACKMHVRSTLITQFRMQEAERVSDKRLCRLDSSRALRDGCLVRTSPGI